MAAKTFERLACGGRLSIGPAVEDRNGKGLEDLLPAPPVREIGQIVGAHDPNKLVTRMVSPDAVNSIDGISTAVASLAIAYADCWMARLALDGCIPLLEWGHACHGFQRILRRNQPPQFIQAKPVDGLTADMKMALMGRIERAAEQSYLTTSGRYGGNRPTVKGERGRALEGFQRFQGRT